MRIERVRIEGFGALSRVDVAWPEGKLLLVVDPNETGKSTFCEAIVTALFGLPRGRVSANRTKDRRRPRSGARLCVGLDLIAEGVHWSVDRDLEAGTFRIVDRDRGMDRTKEFIRSGGRDVFGETVTGLPELLFRSTAYVAQNILDGDRLESTLTLELARIADSGGGEASVVRALKSLQDVRSKMPDAVSGPTVSVETEIVRLTKRVEERRSEDARLCDARRQVADHVELLRQRDARRESSRRALALAGVNLLETDRHVLGMKLEELRRTHEVRAALEREAVQLEDAHLFSLEALQEIDRLREERGTRPELLLAARRRMEETARTDQNDEAEQRRRFGPTASLAETERRRLSEILKDVVENAAESTSAAEALDVQWQELEREGLADDLKRLDALGPADRAFLMGAEEERRSLELVGIRFDRRAADAQAAAAIAVGERRERVKRARALVVIAGLLLPIAVFLFLPSGHVPVGVAASLAVFDAALGLFGAIAWLRGARHRIDDEAGKREEEVMSRREAAQIRKKLSEHRLRLDRVSKAAEFPDGGALIKAHRRARSAEDKRKSLIERSARRDAAVARRITLERAIEPFRQTIACPVGVPTGTDAGRQQELLEDLERSLRASGNRAALRASEAARLQREDEDLRTLEKELRRALERVGTPRVLPLHEALLMVKSGRRRSARRREILEVELPARATSPVGEDVELASRISSLGDEIAHALAQIAAGPEEVAILGTPEEARRAADAARQVVESAEAEFRTAERILAARVREGGERAREVQESLFEAEESLRRALLFRDALDVARDALSSAASSAYSDFRRGLSQASRAILGSWDVPYEALEFADDLSVSVVARGGRITSPSEIASGLSTGAREQLHLTARLAAIHYLGTGDRAIPLLLDDPLVSADDDRFVSVMRFLARDVLAERPVLVISCHAWRHEKLLDRLEPEIRERLSWVSIGASRRGKRGEDDPPAQLRLV